MDLSLTYNLRVPVRHFAGRVLLALTLCCSAQLAQSQNILETSIDPDCNACKLTNVLPKLRDQHSIRFFYRDEWFEGLRITSTTPTTLKNFLAYLKATHGIDFVFREPHYVVFLKPGAPFKTPEVVKEIVIGDDDTGINRREVVLTGKISHAETNAPLPGVNVVVKELNTGVISDSKGDYSLTIPPGNYQISFTAAGMAKMQFEFAVRGSGQFNLQLAEDITVLQEVTVVNTRETETVNTPQAGATTITGAELAKIPAALGEVDVLRAVTSLPGVSSVGEGSSGFNIRGGLAGQNLIMMDEMPIYNPSHLAGFFSTFNPDLVDKVTLYRGGVPAQFGGRSSSFLDVRLKEGDQEKIHGNGGAGLITSRLVLEGPVIRNKSSFIAGFRVAYPNYIIRALRDEQLKKSRAFFYDLNGKYTHISDNGAKLDASVYSSYDNVDFATETFYEFGNTNARIAWEKPLENSVLKISLLNSHYAYSVTGGELDRNYQLDASVNDTRFNVDLSYFQWENHAVNVGWQSSLYDINSGSYTPKGESVIAPLSMPKEKALESALYIQDQFSITPKTTLDAGLRYSMFFLLGPATERIYADGQPRTPNSVERVVDHERGIVKTYGGLEPRASLLYKLSENTSLKAGYHRLYQYIHLITNSTAVTPIDLWKVSNRYIKPNYGDQFSVGYVKAIPSKWIEFSAEAYYRVSNNSIDYKNGATLYLNEQVEADLLQGVGRSYGAELLLRKNRGDFKGWVAYTYSRTWLRFKSDYLEEEINNGDFYPANFDRPHDVKLFFDWRLTNRFSMSGNFSYATGRPITYPESTYEVGGFPVTNFSLRNQYRIPDNHHLDLGFTLDTSLKKKKAVSASWTLSVYNIYGRKNPYSVFFKTDEKGNLQAYRLAIFGSPFVSLTYNFKF